MKYSERSALAAVSEAENGAHHKLVQGAVVSSSCRKTEGLHSRRCMCAFFTLTDRASTIPSNIRGCQSGSTYMVCWTGKDQRNITKKLQREHENRNKTKMTERNNNTKHMPESLVYRQPRAIRTPPGSQLLIPCICTQMVDSIYNSALSGSQVSLSAQLPPLGESSLGWLVQSDEFSC